MNNTFIPNRKINWTRFFGVFIVLLLFSQTFIYTLKVAFTFCIADDWRYIELFLRPYLENRFFLKSLWLDPSHPLPVYSYLFLINAKFFNLQSQYFSYIAIFTQLLLGFYITNKLIKSFEKRETNIYIILTSILIVNLSIFSFTTQTPYNWGIMTIMYLAFLLMLIPTGLLKFSLNYSNNKNIAKNILLIFISSFISLMLFFDWSIIFQISTLIILALLFIIEKRYRKINLIVFITLSLSILISWFYIYVLIGHKTQAMNPSFTEGLINFFSNPLHIYTIMGVELLSGVFNSNFIKNYLIPNSILHQIIAIIFISSFLYINILYFIRKIYRISIFPPTMMLYVLIFIISLFFYRNNLFKDGIFTLGSPRYAQYYMVGIVGYFWAIFLLISKRIKDKPQAKKVTLIIMFILSFIITINWGYNFISSQKRVPHLQNFNRNSVAKLNLRLNDDSVELSNAVRGENINVDKQLQFLNEYHLNIFASNHPLPMK